MSWKIEKIGDQFCVIPDGGTTPLPGAQHSSMKSAERHVAVLYASEGIKGDVSLEYRMENIRRAIWRVLEDMATPASGNAYPVSIFDTYAIISWGDTYYRLNFTESTMTVTIEPSTAWQRVELQWVPIEASAPETEGTKSSKLKSALKTGNPVLHGGPIKAMGNGKIQGYLINFTDADNPDLYGEFFTAKTFYDIEPGERVTLYYQHGQDPVLQKRVLGKGIVTIDDVGLWVEAQLELRDAYELAVYQLAQQGKLGFSSGTLPFLVEYEQQGKSWWVKSWPIGKDASLTPCPVAGPSLTSIEAVKGMMLPISPEGAGDAPELEIATIKSMLLTELELLEVL